MALSSSGSSASAAAVWQSSDTGRPFRRQVGGGDYHRADLCQHHHHHRHRRSLGAVRQICRSSSSHNSTAVYLSLLILSKHAQTEVEKEEKEEESGKRWKRNEQQNDWSKSQKLFWFVLYKTDRWVMSVRRLSCRSCRRRRRLCRLWPVQWQGDYVALVAVAACQASLRRCVRHSKAHKHKQICIWSRVADCGDTR